MRPILYTVLGVLILLAGIYGWSRLGGPNIDSLVQQALTAPLKAKQVEAAQELSEIGQPARDGMAKLLNESDNEDVVSVVIGGLARIRDYESMDNLIASLDHSSRSIRSAAAKAVAKLLGRDHHFPVIGTAAEKAEIKAQIEKDWEEYNGSELFEHNRQRF